MITRSAAWAQPYPVITFYLLAFSISWIGWVPALAASQGILFFRHPLWQGALFFPATGPALAALLVSRKKNRHRLFEWRVSVKWYGFAFLVPVLVVLIAYALSHWLPQTTSPIPVRGRAFAIFLIMSVLANPWEEVGWRGFALARLQMRYSPFIATLIVGVLGRVWHLPLFLLSEGTMSMASLPVWPWVIASLGQAFVLTWLFNRVSGSLVIVSLYHIATNGVSASVGIHSYWALASINVALALGLWLLYGSGLSDSRQMDSWKSGL